MTDRTNHTALQAALLRVLFLMAREDIHAATDLVVEALELTELELEVLLEQLDSAGLVYAERMRLTLPGLAVAASLDAMDAQAQQERVRAMMQDADKPRRSSIRAA